MPGISDGDSNRNRMRGFDIVGGILSVCWPIPLLFALQEGGAAYPWSSGVIIGPLVAGVVALLLFGSYETWVSFKTTREAIFPVRFITNPAMGLILLSMLLLGMPFYAAVVQLPQRFQSVNFTSAERAGILLLPITLLTPVGAMIAGVVIGKKVTAELSLIFGTSIVSIGIGLLSSLPTGSNFSNATYGYEIITGLGLGLATPPYFMLIHTACDEKDISAATGALNMARTLGGCIAIAVCSALHHSVLRSKLPAFLTPQQITAVEETSAYIAKMPADVKEEISRVFGRSYNKQFQIMLAFALLNVAVSCALALVRKRKGIYGMMPVRTIENEFMKKNEEEKEGDGDEEEIGKDNKQVGLARADDASEDQRKLVVDGISRVQSTQKGDIELKRLSRFKELDMSQ
jgi:hypothetical protein